MDALVTDMRNCALIVFRATHTTRTRRTEGSIASAAPPAALDWPAGRSKSHLDQKLELQLAGVAERAWRP